MVSRAEFLQHVIVSGAMMAAALGVVAYVRYRYDVGHRVFRRLALAWAASIVGVVVLSLTSKVTTTLPATVRVLSVQRQHSLHGDPRVPFCTCLTRAFFLHFNR